MVERADGTEKVVARALPRVGLLGNPSDQYGGRALAFTFDAFSAEVEIRPADRFRIVPGRDDALEFPSVREAAERLRERGCYDGVRLLRAALHRFAGWCPVGDALGPDDPRLRFELAYRTDVPRQAGLAGSSAIIVATLRALADWFGVVLPPHELAELALAAETEDLGIAAGPMDRVVQAYGGLLFMDFREPRGDASYRAVDPSALPPLVVAFDPRVGEDSGSLHADVLGRWRAGDPLVRRVVERLPALADAGLEALQRGDHATFQELVRENFELRAEVWPLADRDRAMIDHVVAQGGAAKLCGSGGAIVGIVPGGVEARLLERLRQAGFQAFRPRVAS